MSDIDKVMAMEIHLNETLGAVKELALSTTLREGRKQGMRKVINLMEDAQQTLAQLGLDMLLDGDE